MVSRHDAFRRTVLGPAVLLLAPALSNAQDPRGSITGRVTDPQNATVVSAGYWKQFSVSTRHIPGARVPAIY